MRSLSSAYVSQSIWQSMASSTAKGWLADVDVPCHFFVRPTLILAGTLQDASRVAVHSTDSRTRAAETVTVSLTTDGPISGATLKTLVRSSPS